MLEIRYNKTTKVLTGWWSGESRQGNTERKLQNRSNETITMLNITAPGNSLDEWLMGDGVLIPNPKYTPQPPRRNLLKELDDLKEVVRGMQ